MDFVTVAVRKCFVLVVKDSLLLGVGQWERGISEFLTLFPGHHFPASRLRHSACAVLAIPFRLADEPLSPRARGEIPTSPRCCWAGYVRSLPAGAGRARRQRRCGAATGFAGGRISCWMSPMAWNFSSPGVPYTTIGDPGLSATATPRRPERSAGMSCPSSTRTTTSWSTTACTVPRSSDQRDVSVRWVDALAEGFGSDGVIVLTGVTCSFRGSPTLRWAGGPGSGWTVVAGAAATAAGSTLAALFGGAAAEGLTGPSKSAVVAGPEADDGAGGFV